MRKGLWIFGFIVFAIGLLTAIAGGIVAPQNPGIIVTLIILGIIVGVVNITTKEIITLLVAIIALVVIRDVFEPIRASEIGGMFDSMLSLIATLMAPAAVIASIKALVAVGFPGEN